MVSRLKTAVAMAMVCAAGAATADVRFFERDGFAGRSFTTDRPIGNLERFGFNDRASSVVVRGGRWEVCEDARFEGRCVVLRPGDYPDLAAMGLDNSISSVRPAGHQAAVYAEPERYAQAAPPPAPAYDYHRREGERLYEANVMSVRAVVGPPEERCWVEQQQVVTHTNPGNVGNVNVPGAIIGGVLGGVLGHQIGGGRGRDVATGIGAVGGAVVGSNVGNQYGGGQTVTTQDVQRCAAVPSSAGVDYYDVTYSFRGYEHHVQLTAPPGRTITVNREGEPRI
ncbi:MAG: beta/gamma crystallin-related protein [Burkholderiales bacterium]